MFDYDALHFHTGSVKSTFSKYYFGREGGGHKKSALCTLFIMLTIEFNSGAISLLWHPPAILCGVQINVAGIQRR